MTPLTHPAKKIDQMDSEIKDGGQSFMFKKKFISKKVLIVKEAQNGPLDSSSPKNLPGGQRDWGRGVVLHVQEEVYQSTLTFRRILARDQEWCPWSI